MQGYVYILSTPATRLLKIGKTRRDPIIRAQELSSGTGVPFPYKLEYSVYVNDCSALEHLVHARLAARRASLKREFFDVTLKDAISAIEHFLLDKGDQTASQGADKMQSETSLYADHPHFFIRDVTQPSSSDPEFDAISYARNRMVESTKERVQLFKRAFLKAAEVYRCIRDLEAKPMRNGKFYPPFSFSICPRSLGIYISYLNVMAGEAIYNTGGTPAINEYTDAEAQVIAKEIIDRAAPVFLMRRIETCGLSRPYDCNAVYSARDYRSSLSETELRSYTDSIDVKPDIINYLEGYADLDYLVAKYLDLPYPFAQAGIGQKRGLLENAFRRVINATPSVGKIGSVVSRFLLPPK